MEAVLGDAVEWLGANNLKLNIEKCQLLQLTTSFWASALTGLGPTTKTCRTCVHTWLINSRTSCSGVFKDLKVQLDFYETRYYYLIVILKIFRDYF